MTIIEREKEDAIDQEMTLDQIAKTIRDGIFKEEDFTPEQLNPPVPEKL